MVLSSMLSKFHTINSCYTDGGCSNLTNHSPVKISKMRTLPLRISFLEFFNPAYTMPKNCEIGVCESIQVVNCRQFDKNLST